MEEEKKERDTFFPISTPAICYCGCSASCAYIFFLVHCLGTIFQFIVKLKTQYNSIQFNSAIIHTQSNLLHGFFPRLDCYLLFHFVCYSQAFPGRTASVFECVCMGRTLLLCIIDKFRMFVRGIFFWVRTVFHCYWFGVVWWDVIVVVVILPQFKRMDVVPLSYLSSAFYTYSNTNTSKVLYDTRILRS